MSLAPVAPHILLITGGTRSGKSALALRWAEACATRRIFIATARALDAETAQRVTRHQAERGPGWLTCEEPLHVLAALRRVSRPRVAVVVDCVTMWLTNILYADCAAGQDAASSAESYMPPESPFSSAPLKFHESHATPAAIALAHVQELADWLPHAPGPVALVTAEVGMGIVPPSAAGRAFRDLQGEANQMLAKACSTVLFTSCGLPLPLKNSIPKELL